MFVVFYVRFPVLLRFHRAVLSATIDVVLLVLLLFLSPGIHSYSSFSPSPAYFKQGPNVCHFPPSLISLIVSVDVTQH